MCRFKTNALFITTHQIVYLINGINYGVFFIRLTL